MTNRTGAAKPPAGNKGFQPSDALIRSAETLVLAMAMESTVRPVVEQYELGILSKHQFQSDPKWQEFGLIEAILDRKKVYLLSNEAAKVFHQECFAARDAAGLKVSNPENCPLLEAEADVLRAQNAFIAELGTVPGLEEIAQPRVWTLERRAKVIDLGLRLVAPFVSTADQLLQRVMATATN